MESSQYFHVYNRGVERRKIYQEPRDYLFMFRLLSRYLDVTIEHDRHGYTYPNFHTVIKLHAYCLMPNHFHLLIEELVPGEMAKLMQSLKGAYSRNFNLKYERTGVLFETRYQTRKIVGDLDLMGISRYIHLNALALTREYENYPYSSLKYYLGEMPPPWLQVTQIRTYFSSTREFKTFNEDYVRQQTALAFEDAQFQLTT